MGRGGSHERGQPIESPSPYLPLSALPPREEEQGRGKLEYKRNLLINIGGLMNFAVGENLSEPSGFILQRRLTVERREEGRTGEYLTVPIDGGAHRE
jgi:hypothetical protein